MLRVVGGCEGDAKQRPGKNMNAIISPAAEPASNFQEAAKTSTNFASSPHLCFYIDGSM